jgi:hypothetical protein
MPGENSSAEWVPQERQGVSPDSGYLLHRFQRIPEQEANPARCSKEVGEHRKFAALYSGKEERRTTGPVDTPLDRAGLQTGINLMVYTNQITMSLKVKDAFLKIAVAHEKSPFPVSTASLTDRHIGKYRTNSAGKLRIVALFVLFQFTNSFLSHRYKKIVHDKERHG